MTTEMTMAHVYQAINEVTAVMAGEGIAKARANQQQNYRFRGIDDVYAALSRPLATAKLCILPRVLERIVTERATKSGGVSTYVVLEVEFDLVSAVDGSKHTIRTMGEAMDTADKATNKAMSAAMKYACLMAFQIPTEGDNDADASHHEKSGSSLEHQLSESVDWAKLVRGWETELVDARSLGELHEKWMAATDACRNAPSGIMKRIAAAKDSTKAILSKQAGP